MIEVRISFKDAYLHPLGYVERQLEAAGFPPYAMRTHDNGMVKHWFEDPPGEFIYQWIPAERFRVDDGK
jgi:hypothetical protein